MQLTRFTKLIVTLPAIRVAVDVFRVLLEVNFEVGIASDQNGVAVNVVHCNGIESRGAVTAEVGSFPTARCLGNRQGKLDRNSDRLDLKVTFCYEKGNRES